MNKRKYLRVIRRKLKGLPKDEMGAMIEYFDESIAERIERGMSEEEAVAALGNPEEAAGNIIAEMPVEVRKNIRNKSGFGRAMKIFVLVCASPILISLIAAAFSVVISLVAAYISVVVSVFAAVLVCAAVALGCLVLIFLPDGVGILLGVGAGCVCSGLAIMFALRGIALIRAAVMLNALRQNARRGKMVFA